MNIREKTLIIGGAGFIGTNLTQYLADNGVSTIVADTQRRLDKYAIPIPGVTYVPLEWSKQSTLPFFSDVKNVVHMYCATNPATSMVDITNDAELNTLGTINLLEQVSKLNIEKFVFLSSGGTVYGNSSVSTIDESHPTSPVSAYGVSKLSCEKYVSLYANTKNFSYLNIRLGNPYGEYQLQGTPIGVIANFVLRASRGETIDIFGEGDCVRDFIHIDDVSHTLFLALLKQKLNGTFNLGSGLGYSINEIICKIEQNIGSKITTNHLPARNSDVKSIILQSSKLQNEINYRPKIDMDAGIASLCQECRLLQQRSNYRARATNSSNAIHYSS